MPAELLPDDESQEAAVTSMTSARSGDRDGPSAPHGRIEHDRHECRFPTLSRGAGYVAVAGPPVVGATSFIALGEVGGSPWLLAVWSGLTLAGVLLHFALGVLKLDLELTGGLPLLKVALLLPGLRPDAGGTHVPPDHGIDPPAPDQP